MQYKELKATFENRMRTRLGDSYFDDAQFINLFFESKNNVLEEVCSWLLLPLKTFGNVLIEFNFAHFSLMAEKWAKLKYSKDFVKISAKI